MGNSYLRENGSAPSCPGGYALLEEVGRGGFGTVYKAIQAHTGRIVAVKIPHHSSLTGYSAAMAKAAFEREAMVLARLDHPYIVRLLDYDRPTGSMIFEYAAGHTLRNYLLEKRVLPPVAAGMLMGQVLEALVHMHGRGILHLDLKPQNIMIASGPAGIRIKMLDFGTAACMPDGQQHIVPHALKGNAGTPFYAAPEQLHSAPVNASADLYSWGLVLLECLTGNTRPYAAAGDTALTSVLPDHPLTMLLQKVICKDPAFRPADAGQLWQEYRKVDCSTLTLILPDTDISTFPSDEAVTRLNPLS